MFNLGCLHPLQRVLTPYGVGAQSSEQANLSDWHPLQRALKTYLAEAKFLISGVGIPYSGR